MIKHLTSNLISASQECKREKLPHILRFKLNYENELSLLLRKNSYEEHDTLSY